MLNAFFPIGLKIHADGFCVLHVPVFWSVLSPDRNGIDTSVDASLSLSFRSVLIFNNSFLLTSVNWQCLQTSLFTCVSFFRQIYFEQNMHMPTSSLGELLLNTKSFMYFVSLRWCLFFT